MTLQEIEAALAAGSLYAHMHNGRAWQLRRNGATKRWKTRPVDFSIPVKCGFRTCARISQTSSISYDHTNRQHIVESF